MTKVCCKECGKKVLIKDGKLHKSWSFRCPRCGEENAVFMGNNGKVKVSLVRATGR